MHRIARDTQINKLMEETMIHKMKRNKKIVSAIAVAGMMSLGAAPALAQGSSESDSQKQQQQQSSGLISAETLKGSKVMDSRNREIGELNNVFIDPQTGKISRVDIAFSGDVVGDGKTYSVAWDQLSVKKQGDKIMATLDQSVVDRVAQANRRGESDRAQAGSSSERQAGPTANLTDTDKNKQSLSERTSATEKTQQAISGSQMSANNIRKVQQKLNQEGFHAGSVDGQWSSETQSAIRNFQQSKGLQATGQLDQRTLDELGLDADEMREKSEAESGKDSKKMQ